MVAFSCLGAMTPCRIAELCIGAAIVVACGVLIGVVSAARPYAVIALVVTLVYVFRLWRVLPYERRRATVATAVYARYLLEQSHVPDMTSAREAKAEAAKATTAATDTSPTLLSAGAAPLSRLNTPAACAEREPTYMTPCSTTKVEIRPDFAFSPPSVPSAPTQSESVSRRAPRLGAYTREGHGGLRDATQTTPHGRMLVGAGGHGMYGIESAAPPLARLAHTPSPYRNDPHAGQPRYQTPPSVATDPRSQDGGFRTSHIPTSGVSCVPNSMTRPVQGPGYVQPRFTQPGMRGPSPAPASPHGYPHG